MHGRRPVELQLRQRNQMSREEVANATRAVLVRCVLLVAYDIPVLLAALFAAMKCLEDGMRGLLQGMLARSSYKCTACHS